MMFSTDHLLIVRIVLLEGRFFETGINTNYAHHEYAQAYGEVVSCFRHFSKTDILQPYISQHDFRRDENFNLYVFDIRYREHFSNSKNVKNEFNFRTAAGHGVAVGAIGYALILTVKLSISNGGERNFDFV